MRPLEVVCTFFVYQLSFMELLSMAESPDTAVHANHTCEELLELYANVSAKFTYCAIKFARPIRICERCVLQYEDVNSTHEQILKIEDEKGNKVCKEKLMNLDRLEVIDEGFRYISDLWARAYCMDCFTSVNGTTLRLSNDTINFLEKLNHTMNCISEHSLGNHTYNTSVCIDCEKMYCDLNHFYDSMKNNHTAGVCMDIVDSMNITRVLWSETLSCVQEKLKMDVVLLICSCVIALLPFLFYLSAWIFSTEIRNRLQMQKRLASILRPSTSAET